MANKDIEEVLKRLEETDISKLSAEEVNLISEQLYAIGNDPSIQSRVSSLRAKIGTRQQMLEANAKINPSNAEEIFDKGVENMTPGELSELRVALNRKNSSKVAELDAIIVRKAEEYTKGNNVILKSEDKYKLQDMLKTIAQVSKDEQLKKTAQDVKAIIDEEIKVFEAYYGIDEENLVDIEKVQSNLEALNNMPKDEQLFAREGVNYTAITASELQDVKTVMANRGENDIPEISVLAGALQCKALDDSDRKKLEAWALKRINQTKEKDLGTPETIANFSVLLDCLKDNEDKKSVEKARKLCDKAKANYEAKQPLIHQEFAEINDVLDRIVFTGDLKLLGREKFEGKDDKEMKDLFKEQVRQETMMFLANTTNGEITEEAFKEEYATRLQLGILKMYASEEVLRGTINRNNAEDEFSKRFDKLVKDNKPIYISRDSLVAFHVTSNDAVNTASKRLSLRPGYHPVAKQHQNQINTVDTNCKNRHGVLYNLGKTALISGGWGCAYAIGASLGPVGVAVVGAASFGVSARNLYKDFKKQREEAKAKEEKLSFWSYVKSNKKRVLSTCLSAASACLGGFSAAQVFSNPAVTSIAQAAIKYSGMALGASNVVDAYRKAPKGQKWKHAATAAASFAVGMVTGRAIGGLVSGQTVDVGDSEQVSSEDAQTPQNPQPQVATLDATENPTPTDARPMVDRDGDGIPDYIDRDGGSGSANPTEPIAPQYEQANETQLDRLFDANPKAVNEILGGEWKSSAELHQMMEKGGFTPEQLEAIHGAARANFDENGRIIDPELREFYEEKARTEALRRQNIEIEPIKPLGVEPLEIEIPDIKIEPIEIKLPEPDIVDVKEINIKGDDTIKVKGEDFNGDRVKMDLNMTSNIRPEDINTLTEQVLGDIGSIDVDKIKFGDDNTVTIIGDKMEGVHITSVINEKGEYVSININGKEVSAEYLNTRNSNPTVLELNSQAYEKIMDVRGTVDDVATTKYVGEASQDLASKNDINITKIELTEEGFKVTGSKEGGYFETSVMGDAKAWQEVQKNMYGEINGISYNEDNNIVLHAKSAVGEDIAMTINSKGEVVGYQRGEEVYNDEQLKEFSEKDVYLRNLYENAQHLQARTDLTVESKLDSMMDDKTVETQPEEKTGDSSQRRNQGLTPEKLKVIRGIGSENNSQGHSSGERSNIINNSQNVVIKRNPTGKGM